MTEQISWWKTALGTAERDAIAAALAAGQLSEGRICGEFESGFAALVGARFAVAVPSGSTALLMALIALGVGPGDEVIVPDFTWVATAHAAALLGAKVVLVDTRSDRPLMAASAVAKRITGRTKVILPVHLAGRAVEMAPLLELAGQHGVAVVEDACQALLSRGEGRFLGTSGQIGCYSLGVSKLLTTGQGGVAVTSDPALYQRLKLAKFHGVRPSPAGWEEYVGPGLNLKFPDMLAAIGLVQMARATERVANVSAIYRAYREGLQGLETLRVSPVDLESGEVPLWTEIETPYLEAVVAHLSAASLGSRRVHPPLHLAPHLAQAGDFPNASRFASQILVLPSGPDQPLDNVQRTIEVLRRFVPPDAVSSR